MKKTVILVSIATLLAFTLLGCGKQTQHPQKFQDNLAVGTHQSTTPNGNIMPNYTLSTGIENHIKTTPKYPVELNYNITLKTGSVSLQLTDPSGKTAYSKTYTAKDSPISVDTMDFSNVSGSANWEIHLTGDKNATGTYSINLFQKD